MEVKEVLFMNKGEGENSYVQNSRFPQIVASKAKPALEVAVQFFFSEEFEFLGKRVVTVADLGCSLGPNTFSVMSTVMEIVEKICRESKIQIPELQIHLNDLPGNDFNTLFNNGLSGFYERNRSVAVPFFVMGVPGSFHGRLFPRNTMDLIYSLYSVHWLSQAPKLSSKEGLPLNKGNMYVSKTSIPIVRELYADQFQVDFTSFLKSRSEEMVSHGCIVLILQGENTIDIATNDFCYTWKLLTDAMTQMISQGLVDEEKLDSFNVPFYAASTEEIQNLVNMEGTFTIEHMETFTTEGKEGWLGESEVTDPREIAAKNYRCFTESMVSHHFGEEILEELYGKFVPIVLADDISKGPIMIPSIIVVLRRNIRF